MMHNAASTALTLAGSPFQDSSNSATRFTTITVPLPTTALAWSNASWTLAFRGSDSSNTTAGFVGSEVVGAEDGAAVGEAVGWLVDGAGDGEVLGKRVGAALGATVGASLGKLVGALVLGAAVGALEPHTPSSRQTPVLQSPGTIHPPPIGH